MKSNLIVTQWDSYDRYDHRTIRTWARVLSSYEEVPFGFRPHFPEPPIPMPYTIFLPQETGIFFQKRPPQLLWLEPDQLIILEAVRETVIRNSYPLESILYLEHGMILLKSWLTLRTPAHITTMTFNTVSDRRFLPIIKAIRRNSPPSQSNGEQHRHELAKLSYLNTVNYKYMNFGRHSIMPGDTIIRTVYQPAMWIETVTMFRKTLFKTYLTPHLSILTDRELILLTEHSRTKKGEEKQYGGVFTYIPLRHIQQISFTTKHSNLVMNIQLSDTIHLCSEFSSGNNDIEALAREYAAIRLGQA